MSCLILVHVYMFEGDIFLSRYVLLREEREERMKELLRLEAERKRIELAQQQAQIEMKESEIGEQPVSEGMD